MEIGFHLFFVTKNSVKILSGSTTAIDAVFVIQKHIGNQTIFAELENTLFQKLKTEASVCGRTDAVLDVYMDESDAK